MDPKPYRQAGSRVWEHGCRNLQPQSLCQWIPNHHCSCPSSLKTLKVLEAASSCHSSPTYGVWVC